MPNTKKKIINNKKSRKYRRQRQNIIKKYKVSTKLLNKIKKNQKTKKQKRQLGGAGTAPHIYITPEDAKILFSLSMSMSPTEEEITRVTSINFERIEINNEKRNGPVCFYAGVILYILNANTDEFPFFGCYLFEFIDALHFLVQTGLLYKLYKTKEDVITPLSNTFRGIEAILKEIVLSENIFLNTIHPSYLTRQTKTKIVNSMFFDSDTFYGDLMFKSIKQPNSIVVPNKPLIELINTVLPPLEGGSRSNIKQKAGALPRAPNPVRDYSIEELHNLFEELGKGIDEKDYENDSRHDELHQMIFSGEDSAILHSDIWDSIKKNVRIIVENDDSKIDYGRGLSDVTVDELRQYLFMYDAGTVKGIDHTQNYNVDGYCPLGTPLIGSVTPMSSYTDPATTRRDKGINPFSCLKQLKTTTKVGEVANPQFLVMKEFLRCCASFISGIPKVNTKCSGIISWLKTGNEYGVTGLSPLGRKLTISVSPNGGLDEHNFIWEANQSSLANFIINEEGDAEPKSAKPRSSKIQPDEDFEGFCRDFNKTKGQDIIHICRFFKYCGDKSHIVKAILLILSTGQPVIILTIDRLLFKSVVQVIEKASILGTELELETKFRKNYELIAKNLGVMMITMATGMTNIVKQTEKGSIKRLEGLVPKYRYYGLYKQLDGANLANNYVSSAQEQIKKINEEFGLVSEKALVYEKDEADSLDVIKRKLKEIKYYEYQGALNDLNSFNLYLSELNNLLGTDKFGVTKLLGSNMTRSGRGVYPNYFSPGGTNIDIVSSQRVTVLNTIKILTAILGLLNLNIFELLDSVGDIIKPIWISWAITFSKKFQEKFLESGGVSKTDAYITQLIGETGLDTKQLNMLNLLRKQYGEIYDLTKKLLTFKPNPDEVFVPEETLIKPEEAILVETSVAREHSIKELLKKKNKITP